MALDNISHCDCSCSSLDVLGSVLKGPRIITHNEVEYNLTRALGGRFGILYNSIRNYFKRSWQL